MRQWSIASVTVAYNAATILSKQLNALQGQTRRLDEIIVVNNASTDSTLELLQAQYPNVTVLNLDKNAGVGGGFSEGLIYAMRQKGHDWVWLLDDDSVPRNDGLEKLLNGLNSLNGSADRVGIVAPTPVHSGTNLSYCGLLWKNGWVAPSPDQRQQPISFVDTVISSGTLIRREAVDKAGLPRADFFMDFVDFEHCLRVRRNGYEVAIVRDSLLDHAIGTPRTVRLFGYSRPWSDHAPWREYYMSRNKTFMVWNDYPDWKTKLFILRKLARRAAGIIFFGQQKSACVKSMISGFLDGRAGKLGIRSWK